MADTPSAPPENAVKVPFHYIKSNHFRVIFGEGVYGGVTPRGMLAFAIYNERAAIPQQTFIEFVPGAMPGPEKVVATREGMVREVETEILMDYSAASEFHRWLGTKLEEWRALQEAAANVGS